MKRRPLSWLLAFVVAMSAAKQARAMDMHRAPATGVLLECAQAATGWKCEDRANLVASATGGARLRAVWGDADGSHLYLAGDGGVLVRLTRTGAILSAERVEINSPAPFKSDLTAMWGAADGRRAWIGGDGGEILSVGPEGPAMRASIGGADALVSAGGSTPPITGGWMSANGQMWVTGGNTAHLFQVWGASLAPVRTFVDAADDGEPTTLVGVAGVDDGGHWTVALADDVGRIILADESWTPGPLDEKGKAAIPPNANSSPGRGTDAPLYHLYRTLSNVPGSGASGGTIWAGTWYGRVRRLLLTPGGVQKQCSDDVHACVIEPRLVAANDAPEGRVAPQLSLSNVNAVTGKDPENVFVLGDHGLAARYSQSAKPEWSRVDTLAGDDPFVNFLAGWMERGAGSSVWIAGERVCPGRNVRPAGGVANVTDYWREGDSDDTGAFQCAAIALCPHEWKTPCGGVISVPTGVFPIHDTLDLDQEINLEGRGEGSIIEWRGTGRHLFGGNRVAIDIHGRPPGECAGDCAKRALFNPAAPAGSSLTTPLAAYWRGPISISHLTLRANSEKGADSCAGDSVAHGAGVPDSVGIDIHEGSGALRRGGHFAMLEGVRVCGFKAGLRLGGITQDDGFRGLTVMNNWVGVDIENAIQHDFADVDAERNGIGVLAQGGEVSFRGLRLSDNTVGGFLGMLGFWVLRGVRGIRNVRQVGGVRTGFDVALLNGHEHPAGLRPPSSSSLRLDVKPLPNVGLPWEFLSDMTLDGRDGVPGRILVVNVARGMAASCPQKGGRVAISRTGGASAAPELDVLNECDASVIVTSSDVTLRRLKEPDVDSANFLTELTTSIIPGYLVRRPSDVPAGHSANLTQGAPSVRMRADGQLVVGTRLAAASPFASPAPLTTPAVDLIGHASPEGVPGGILRLELPDANATIASEPYASLGVNLVFSAGGKERARLSAFGRLGVGTKTPEFAMDVNGDARVDGRVTLDGLRLQTGLKVHCDSSVLGSLFMGVGADGRPALLTCAEFGISVPVQ